MAKKPTGITLEVAQMHLDAWLKAELEVSINQTYTIGGKTFTRAELAQIRREIDYWRNIIASLNNAKKHRGRNRTYRIVPRDL